MARPSTFLQLVFVATLAAALAMPCLGWWLLSVRPQRLAVQSLRAMGAQIRYETPDEEWPDWLVDTLGDDAFYHVLAVIIRQNAAEYQLDCDHITDREFDQIGQLGKLQLLVIDHSELTEARLERLKQIGPAKSISLGSKSFTDQSLQQIAGLGAAVDSLDLTESSISDRGLAQFDGLQELRVLSLGKTRVSSYGLKSLQSMKSLEWLDLDGAQISSAALENLSGLGRLQHLNLNDTQVDDAGIEQLERLESLQWIGLSRTGVTPAGAARLRRALPHCQIELN